MDFALLNERIRDLRNELQELNNEPLPYTTNQEKDIEVELADLQDEVEFYSRIYTQLAALYPNIITLPDNDTISKRDYLKRYDKYEPSQAVRMIVQELTSKFQTPVQFETTYINKRKQAETTQAAKAHSELNQMVLDVMRQSDIWLKDHPTEESKQYANLARSTWNTGHYQLTQNGVDSFINQLKRIGALPTTNIIRKTLNRINQNA